MERLEDLQAGATEEETREAQLALDQAMLDLEEQVLLRQMTPAEAMEKYAEEAQKALDEAYES